MHGGKFRENENDIIFFCGGKNKEKRKNKENKNDIIENVFENVNDIIENVFENVNENF